jgi:carbon storage regulator
MLILTRKIDQSIVIQGNIKVVVLGVERDRVKLGIAAPAEVTVLRQELFDEENRAEVPSPLRRKAPKPSLTPTEGSLALKPRPKPR